MLLRSGRAASSPQRGCAQRYDSHHSPVFQTLTRAGQGRLCDVWYYFFVKFCPKIGLHKKVSFLK
jgi:hypothetical protein